MEYGTLGEPERTRVPCEVRITDAEIVVDYADEHGHVLYRGTDSGDGHFELQSHERRGTATLHRARGSACIEGFWHEETYEGWWFIDLGEPDCKAG
jgi:hypothetical protein